MNAALAAHAGHRAVGEFEATHRIAPNLSAIPHEGLGEAADEAIGIADMAGLGDHPAAHEIARETRLELAQLIDGKIVDDDAVRPPQIHRPRILGETGLALIDGEMAGAMDEILGARRLDQRRIALE